MLSTRWFSPVLFLAANLIACGSDDPPGPSGSAGASGSGFGGIAGSAAGGAAAGAAQAGSTAAGGSAAGASSGAAGTGTGGSSAPGGSGGTNSGGASAGAGGSTPGAGAGGTAAGSGGSGAGAGGSSGGAATGCGAKAIFCEDFETYASGKAQKTERWEPVTDTGTVAIDGTHARGSKALHLTSIGNGKAYIALASFAPPNNSFFARMYAWVEAFPTAPNYAHYTMVEATGTMPGQIRPIGGQYIQGQGNFWGAGSDGGPTGDWTNWKTSAPAESGKWLCIEFQLAAADNNINVWIDGVAKTDLSVSTKNHGGQAVDFVFPTFNKIWFGWWLYHANPTPNQFEIWLDDIGISSERLGCAP
jgi:hypothetical protein